MANRHRGEIAAEFEGKAITLALPTGALCALEEADGRPIMKILDEVGDPENMRITTLRRVFWAMMLKDRPEATLEDAETLIDGLRGKENQIMADAFRAAFPDPAPGEDEPGK